MNGWSYPLAGLLIALGAWASMDGASRAHPSSATILISPQPAAPSVEDLSPEEKALFDFLQHDGMAAMILYGGYVITPPPPKTGVTAAPKDKPKDKPKDNSGNPKDPPDETEEPPEHTPEPATMVLGLVGLGVTSLAYLRRRKRGAEKSKATEGR